MSLDFLRKGCNGGSRLRLAFIAFVFTMLVLGVESRDVFSQTNVALFLWPASVSVNTDDEFSLDIVIAAGDQRVDTVKAYIDFEPARLRVVDASGNPASSITRGTVLTTVQLNSASNSTGRIDFEAMGLGGTSSGTFTLATIRFRALGSGGGTSLFFSVIRPRNTSVVYQQQSVLGSLSGTAVYFRSSPTPTPTPAPTPTRTPTPLPPTATPIPLPPTATPAALVGVADQLASLGGSLGMAIAYDPADPADQWKIYDPNAPAFANDLARLQAGRGYWVLSKAAATLTYAGNSYRLSAGWNLVGWLG